MILFKFISNFEKIELQSIDIKKHEKPTPTLGLDPFPEYFSTKPWAKHLL